MVNMEMFMMAGKDLHMLGLVPTAGGSISERDGDKIFITKKNAFLGHLKEEDIIEVPLEGPSPIDESASRDLNVHRGIYKESAHKAVIHAHPPYGIAVAMGADNKLIPLDSEGISSLRSIPVVRAKDRNSVDEASKLLPSIYKSGYVISIIKENGSYAVGASIMEALHYTVCLEMSCKVIAVNKKSAPAKTEERREMIPRARRSAIPPSIGVMDRNPHYKRGFGNR
jgi:L-fuculose-phosphate aldolase